MTTDENTLDEINGRSDTAEKINKLKTEPTKTEVTKIVAYWKMK